MSGPAYNMLNNAIEAMSKKDEEIARLRAEVVELKRDKDGLERIVTISHDAMVEAEDALTEFCGHNDETRGGWALQSLSNAVAAISATTQEGGDQKPTSHP